MFCVLRTDRCEVNQKKIAQPPRATLLHTGALRRYNHEDHSEWVYQHQALFVLFGQQLYPLKSRNKNLSASETRLNIKHIVMIMEYITFWRLQCLAALGYEKFFINCFCFFLFPVALSSRPIDAKCTFWYQPNDGMQADKLFNMPCIEFVLSWQPRGTSCSIVVAGLR